MNRKVLRIFLMSIFFMLFTAVFNCNQVFAGGWSPTNSVGGALLQPLSDQVGYAVYGPRISEGVTPNGGTYPQSTSGGEPRYYGYNYDGVAITNPRYPAEAAYTGNEEQIGGYSYTWNTVRQDPTWYDYTYGTQGYNAEANVYKAACWYGWDYAELLVAPTSSSEGAFRIHWRNKVTGALTYMTFIIPKYNPPPVSRTRYMYTFYFDEATGANLLSGKDRNTHSYDLKTPGQEKTDYFTADTFEGYTFDYSTSTPDGSLAKQTPKQYGAAGSTRSGTVWYDYNDSVYIIFWYKNNNPPDPDAPTTPIDNTGSLTPTTPTTPTTGNGKIIFEPNSTPWTNSSKQGEGKGAYPVKVTYVGDNPVVLTGSCEIETRHKHTSTSTNADGSTSTSTYYTYTYSTASFPVNYYLNDIAVSKDVNTTLPGTSGNVAITHEGAYLGLHGEGHWKSPQYTLPSVGGDSSIVGVNIPSPPPNPVGNSGTYKLDWTNPNSSFNVPAGIFSTNNGAQRRASILGNTSLDSYYGKLTFYDNLSGVKNVDYAWTYGSSDIGASYTNLYSSPYTENDRGAERIVKDIEKPVGDNVYLHVKITDMAGNFTYNRYGPFEDPIKLKNFQVTDVRDPAWDKVFWQSDMKTPTGKTYPVNQLPLDNTSNPVYQNASIKKGYAFYFDVTSEYLYRDYDKIVITPTYYYWDGSNRTPVDMYYSLDNNPFIKAGSSADTCRIVMHPSNGDIDIGQFLQETLTKGVRVDWGRVPWANWKGSIQYTYGKEQYWYGKYYIPATAIFTPQGIDGTLDE